MSGPIVLDTAADGRALLGGAFYMMDTEGLPLEVFLDFCASRSARMSVPHFYAQAVEHGWDDVRALDRLRAALRDAGEPVEDFEKTIEEPCRRLFMEEMAKTPQERDARVIGKRMRLALERGAREAVTC